MSTRVLDLFHLTVLVQEQGFNKELCSIECCGGSPQWGYPKRASRPTLCISALGAGIRNSLGSQCTGSFWCGVSGIRKGRDKSRGER